MNRRKGPPPTQESAWPSWLLPAGIALLTFLAFLPALRAGFVNWDDDKNFLTNPLYRGLGWTQLSWMFTTFYQGMYQPVFWLGAGMDYSLWGMDAYGYHLINLLLHSLNAFLFYFLSLRLLRLSQPDTTPDADLRWGAAFAALLFSVHPLRVESVVWITELKDVLSGAFYLATVICYVDDAAGQTRMRRLAPSLLFFTLGLFSKASGVGLPFILIALDIFPLKRLPISPKRWLSAEFIPLWIDKLPYFALSLAAGVAGLASKQAGIMKVGQFSMLQRIAQAFYGLVFYIGKTLLPMNLYPLHELPANFDPFAWPFLLCAVIVFAALSIIFVRRENSPGFVVSLIAYLAFLGPVLGLVKWNLESVADRYTYLACMGWAVLAGGALVRLERSEVLPRVYLRGAAALLLTAYAAITWQQTQRWHDSISFWKYDLSMEPQSALAHYDMAAALFDEGRIPESIPELEEAIRLKPDYFDAIYDLGNDFYKLGQLTPAQEKLEAALKLRPDFSPAWNNLGNVLQDRGQPEAAISAYNAAISHQPDYAEAYFNRGNSLFKANHLKEAITSYDQALRLKPDLSVAQQNKELALRALGKKS